MRRALPAFLIGALLLAGCRAGGAGGPITVSLIGERSGTPSSAFSDNPVATGLVRLDREGQVVPGAAARWAILEDGLDYIFRIDDAAGPSAAVVARRLRSALRQHAHDPDFAALSPIESVKAVTATVVEIRLSVPQQDLLSILARPEFAIAAPISLRVASRDQTHMQLDPRPGEDAASPILLRVERAGRAVARFQAGESDFVTGGTFADLPVARAAKLPGKTLRFDPATGLFGLAIRNRNLDPALRTALSLAIDRDRIVAMVGAPGQAKATTIAGSTIEPNLDQRRNTARALLAGRTAQLRVAMPPGPGGRLLLALLTQDWRTVGIDAMSDRGPADLDLVDEVAPAGTSATLACAVSAGCDPRDRMALINPPFIPIAAPLRWSLVAPKLDLFTENAAAAHPLDQLRSHR